MWLDYTAKDAARFWAKVDTSAGMFECWLWTACISGGYGMIGWGKRNEHASRVSYLLANGPFPNELEVLHKCDNPPCVNPAHLLLGTHQQNMDDMTRKHRYSAYKGEKHPNAKLTNAQVDEIRKRVAERGGIQGVTFPDIAEEFGISVKYVYEIAVYRTRKYSQTG